MKKIKEIIVVEGKSDKQFLETFLDADILTCNGSAIDGFDLNYLIQIGSQRGIIILTDPDYPGEKIRKEISSKLNGCKHAFVRKENSIKKHKVGVAESSKEEVLLALENLVTFDQTNIGLLTSTDMYNLKIGGSDSKANKKLISSYYHLGHCNTKTLLHRLNMLNVSKDELEKVLNDSK